MITGAEVPGRFHTAGSINDLMEGFWDAAAAGADSSANRSREDKSNPTDSDSSVNAGKDSVASGRGASFSA